MEEINQAFAKQAAIDLQKKLEKAEELQNKQRLEREQKKLEQVRWVGPLVQIGLLVYYRKKQRAHTILSQ